MFFLDFPLGTRFFFCLCREKNTKITKAIFDLDGSPFLWFPFAFSSSFCCQSLHRQRQYPISQNPPPFCLLEGMVFGDFSSICSKAPLPLCTLVKPLKGTQNVDTIYHAWHSSKMLCTYSRSCKHTDIWNRNGIYKPRQSCHSTHDYLFGETTIYLCGSKGNDLLLLVPYIPYCHHPHHRHWCFTTGLKNVRLLCRLWSW